MPFCLEFIFYLPLNTRSEKFKNLTLWNGACSTDVVIFLDNFSLKVSESGHFEVHIKKRKRKLQKRKERVEIKSAHSQRGKTNFDVAFKFLIP